MAHSFVEERQEVFVPVGIEAYAADEEEQGHVEGIDEDAGDGLGVDAMANDNEDDADAFGYVEGDVTVGHEHECFVEDARIGRINTNGLA